MPQESTESIDGSAVSISDAGEIFSLVPKNVGHLLPEPVEFICPACNQLNISRVEREAVTLLQRFVCGVNFLLCCNPIRWQGKHDINHYCSHCGCYIGRYISLSWYKRALFRLQRSEIDDNNKWQSFRKVQKEELDDKKLKKQRAALAKA